MAPALFNMLLFFGHLTAVFGVQPEVAAVEVNKGINGTRDILTILFPTDWPFSGAKGTATSTKTSEAPEDSDGFGGVVISKPADISGNLPGKVNGKGNGNVHLNVSGDVTGTAKDKVTDKLNEAPGNVHGDVNSDVKHNVSGHVIGEVSDDGEIQGSPSENVPNRVNANVPNKGSGKVPVGVNGTVPDRVNDKVNSKKSSKLSGASEQTTPGKVIIEPYFIIDAPIRSDDEGHGCKNGQRWSFGHCREILE